jgi:lipase ATG15
MFAQVALLAGLFWIYASDGLPGSPTIAEAVSVATPKPSGFTLKHLIQHGAGQPGPRALRLDVNSERFMAAEAGSQIGPFTGIHLAPVKIERPALRNYNPQIPMSPMWITEDIQGPDVEDKETVISFANMSENAYKVGRDDDGWMDIDEQYNASIPFGWDDSGIRGHVFADDTNSTVSNVLRTMCLLFLLTYRRYVKPVKLSLVVSYNKMLHRYCFAKPLSLYFSIH